MLRNTMLSCYRPSFKVTDFAAVLDPADGREEFECAVAARMGVRYGVAFASGSLGFLASLKALDIRDAEVILPAFNCPTMLNAVLASGNQPIFVDIRLDDYNLDASRLAGALSKRTRVVVVTHMYGYLADMARVRDMLEDKAILLVEDCAQRMPPASASEVRPNADLVLCSFGPSKPMCTICGGVMATNSRERFERILAYRDDNTVPLTSGERRRLHAWWLASLLVYRPVLYGPWQRARTARLRTVNAVNAPTRYSRADEVGKEFADFQGALGCRQLGRLDAGLTRRREIAGEYEHLLRPMKGVQAAPVQPGATYTHYTVRVDERHRARIAHRMHALGVMTNRTFDTMLPALAQKGQATESFFPQAELAARQILNLPMHAAMNRQSVRRVVDALGRAVTECGNASP